MKINYPILFSAFFVLAFLSSVRPSRCFEADDVSVDLAETESLGKSVMLENIGSADSVKVTGCVTDEDGMAVEYVSVEIISVADTMSVAIGTFEEGRFIFNDIQPGKYRLRSCLKFFLRTFETGFRARFLSFFEENSRAILR